MTISSRGRTWIIACAVGTWLAAGVGNAQSIAPRAPDGSESDAKDPEGSDEGESTSDEPAGEGDTDDFVSAGEVIIVTGTRSPEKRFDAPVNVESITSQQLERNTGTSYLSALENVKGIDFADAGVLDQRYSIRGFNTLFNTRILSMIDGRLASNPGTGVGLGNSVPAASLDMKAVEVIVGPASAIYGANAHTGVINIITKTPWDQSGATLSLRGGTQDFVEGAMRVAGTVRDRFGWKLTTQYMRAEDFKPDRREISHYYGTSFFEGDLLHDYDAGIFTTDGSLYYKAGDWMAKANAGYSNVDSFSVSNIGRLQFIDFSIFYQSAQLSHKNWYFQVTRTDSSAGDTYAIQDLAAAAQQMVDDNPDGPRPTAAELDPVRESLRVVNDSQMVDSEAQYRNTFAGFKTTVGLQGRVYLPDASFLVGPDGSPDIRAVEVGGYAQLDYKLLDDRLRLVGAARLDTHTYYPTQLSPSLATVFDINPKNKLRLSYNRAFKSPTLIESFLLFSGGLALGNSRGFTVQDASGNVVSEIDPLVPEKVDSIELGYRSAISSQLYVEAVVYNAWYRNFISALSAVSNPFDPDNPTFAYTSDGDITAEGTGLDGYLLTYTNFGRATVRGADIGFNYNPSPQLSLSASGSVIDLASFTSDDGRELLLNVPRWKFKVSATVGDMNTDRFFMRVSARYHTAYEFESGYWSSAALLMNADPPGKVPARTVASAALGYNLPDYDMSIQLHLANMFGDENVDVLGAPVSRRRMFLQLKYHYDGLNY